MKLGTKIRILIDVPISAQLLQINLQRGSELQGRYICLHVNPRWNDKDILYDPFMLVLNSRDLNKWNKNYLKFSGMDFLFRLGEVNEVVLYCTSTGWQVSFVLLLISIFSHFNKFFNF